MRQSTAEILKDAGLNFEVFKVPMVAVIDPADEKLPSVLGSMYPNGVEIQSTKVATCRMLGNKPHILGVVGKNYSLVQNSEAFEVFSPLFENDLVSLHKAGCFGNGTRVYIQAKINTDELEIVPGAIVTPYILLAHSFDGSLSINFGFVDEQVTCQNSLTRIVTNKENKLMKVRHKGLALENLDKIRESMDIANQQFIASVETYKELAKIPMNQENFKKFVKQVFSIEKLEDQLKKEDDRKSRVIEDLERLFETSPGNELPGIKGSVWGAVSAVTRYTKFERGNSKTTDEKRLESVWMGTGKTLNEKAMNLAISML